MNSFGSVTGPGNMLFAGETVRLSYLMRPHIIMSTDRYVQDHYALGLLCPWQLYPRTAMFTNSYFDRPLCSRTYDCVHRHALFTDRCVNGALCSRTDVSTDSYVHGPLCSWTDVSTDRFAHGPVCQGTAIYTDRYVHKPLCLPNAVSM